jgi:hypothetical protein
MDYLIQIINLTDLELDRMELFTLNDLQFIKLMKYLNRLKRRKQ